MRYIIQVKTLVPARGGQPRIVKDEIVGPFEERRTAEEITARVVLKKNVIGAEIKEAT